MTEIQNELPRIKDGENPDNLAHAQINGAFTPLNTTEGFNAANKFTEIENKWTDGVRVFAARIQRSSSAAWEGPAAESARAALSNYTTRAQDLSPVLQALGNRVYGAVDSINATKRELPEVIEKGKTWTPTLLPNTSAIARTARDDAESTAREVMGIHYVDPFIKADSEIPVLPKPDDPTQPLIPPVRPPGDGRIPDSGGEDTGGEDGGNDNGGGEQGGDDSGGGEQGGPGSAGEAEEPGTGIEEPGGEPAEEPQEPGTTAANTTDPFGTPVSTLPRTTDPMPTSTTPAGVGTAGYSPSGLPGGGMPGGSTGSGVGAGGSGSGGSGGSGSGGSGSGGSGSGTGSGSEKPGAGRSIPGNPGAVAGQVGAAANAAARTAAATGRGMMGMPMGGLGAGAGRGGSATEDEHKTPDYLITAANTDELLGEVPKTVPGGVIGGDIPTAPAHPENGDDRR
ncbi:hypothetical protein [Nocardia cyriacigeorgica]|uniref:hypothetical protein n=1 Tax=Nocardia cyriacigeorgica TaxID=135487 RepID=UPI00245556AC|nr:hypothetical protein [Nocardia cyriacigeorgica]